MVVRYAIDHQVALRFIEMNVDDRQTIGEAADKINAAAKDSVKIVQAYLENSNFVSS